MFEFALLVKSFGEDGFSSFQAPRKLVIRIGAQKCAFSSLQASLDLLAEAAKDNFGFATSSLSFCVWQAKPSPGQEWGHALDCLDDILAFQASSQVVISHEMLGDRPGR